MPIVLGGTLGVTDQNSVTRAGVNINNTRFGHNTTSNILTITPKLRMQASSAVPQPNSNIIALNDFWTYRTGFFRTGTSTSAYPGDTSYGNGPENRLVSTQTATFSYSNASLAASLGKEDNNDFTYHLANGATVFLWACGSSASITSYSTTPAGTYTSIYNAGEISVRRSAYSGKASDITSATETWSRTAGNSGSWSAGCIFPGVFSNFTTTANPTANAGDYYIRTLPAGRALIVLSGSGPDGNSNVTPTGTSNIIQGANWWYNGSIYQIIVNPTTSDIQLSWLAIVRDNYNNPLNNGFFGYSRVFIEVW